MVIRDIIRMVLYNYLKIYLHIYIINTQLQQWDDRIAAVAQKWAKQCRLAHDTEREVIGMSIINKQMLIKPIDFFLLKTFPTFSNNKVFTFKCFNFKPTVGPEGS